MIISIITICLNDKKALMKTRKSVECQLCHDYEHIIIDGGSDDGTLDYLTKLDEKVIWVSEPDEGRSDAFNKGLAMASGELILCLNAGDCLYDENVIAEVIKDWEKDPVDVLSYMVEMDNGQIMWCKDEEHWNRGLHAHQGMFVTKQAYKKLGGYNICLKSRMDYDLFLRMAKLNFSHRLINRVVARFDTNGISQYDKKLAFSEGIGLKLIYENSISVEDYNKLSDYTCVEGCADNRLLTDDKDKKYALLLNWMNKLISDKRITQYLELNGVKRVSIYGAGQMGALLKKSLEQSDTEIVELIDAVKGKYIGKMASVSIEEMNSDIDAVIVTVIDGYEEISKRIKENHVVEVVSLKEIVASL